ncbi:MAG: hypothetical protein AAF384_01570 [Pseudomonadota bacterium]
MKRFDQSRGFTLLGAVFLIVIVSLLAGFLVSIVGLQKTSTALSTLGARAHYAAISGLEWGVHQTLTTTSCFTSPTTFSVGGIGGEFEVTLTCVATAGVQEGALTYDVFDLDAIAEFGTAGNEDYVSRRLSASVTTSP